MPPKAAAVAVPAAIERKDGAKVVYVSICGEQDLMVALNPVCHLDILLDAAIKALSKNLSARQQKAEVQLQALAGSVAGDAESPELPAVMAARERYRTAAAVLHNSATAASVTLIDAAGSPIVLDGIILEGLASEVLRPSGQYKLATLGDGPPRAL